MQDWNEIARAWLDEDPDPETREELETLLAAGDEAGLAARFDGTLSFGTAGIRGLLGAGPRRMNRVVVRRVSAGLAAYWADALPEAPRRGVVIGFDGRKNSRVFAEDAARVFLGAGWRVWLSPDPVPTPVVAFAARDLGAAVGVVVTASHNPPEYNGYKVYGPDAAQILSPHDQGIAARIAQVGRTDRLPLVDPEHGRDHGRLFDLDEATLDRYLQGVRALSLHPGAARKAPLRVAHTALHGVGGELAEAVLRQAGFDDLHPVASQRDPDPAFPTVRFPNPEEPGAMDAVLALARETGADLAVANDPDADRLACALPGPAGWQLLTGDQLGQILAWYRLTQTPAGAAPPVVATSVVSSQLLGRMAADLGATCVTTLTGFKWIIHGALEAAEATGGRPVFAYEEALGYCVGELVRDKDGLSALATLVEAASWAKGRGWTLWDLLERIYRDHGLYLTRQVSLTLPGAEGVTRIAGAMARFRAAPPSRVGEWAVTAQEDLLEAEAPSRRGDVLILHLSPDARILLRPSGTEPKLKAYYEVRTGLEAAEPFDAARSRAEAALEALVSAHRPALDAAVGT